MRKAQKQDILNMIQTLHEAHDEIKSNINSNKIILAQDMLSQCQECAVSIGTAIEKLEGEGFVTVSLIETYCELLFSIYEELSSSDINANKIFKNLKKQLLRIENSVKNDIPIRKEVAFFPYKASMWDALESVYLAAKEDPNCDAYCVPIPYYDRNPDRSLGAMHYEGLEYPKNIEVVDWNTYNFEERKPDVIYIHNPYDDWNFVTCVHPRYFSNNLKKYTDKLVYIPYFILNEIEPDDQNSIDNMKHFIWTPGVINADKVIVQSEKMKQIYVNEYLKAAQANGLQGKHIDRKCLEEKFLGLGSPKIDKVLNTKKEDLEIPQEWLKIIEKPDGSWKKIILYNTSIGALLQHNEKMLEKMKYVFGVFKENKDEVALLWRPHPLIQSTVSSMRPQLWVEYEKLVRQYREEGWGIYDDSSDMDRAVVLSDAYYGDASSVVQLFKNMKKTVMLQQCEGNAQRENINLKIGAGVLYQKKVYFSEFGINGLFCLDIETENVHFLKRFEKELQNFKLYRDAYIYGNVAWFLPWKGKYIVKVNLDSLEMKYYEVPFHTVNTLSKNKFDALYFTTMLVQDRFICMIPTIYDAVIVIDMKEEKIYPFFDVIDTKKEIYPYGFFADNVLWLCSYNGAEMIKLNLATGEKERVSWNSSEFYYSGVEYVNGTLYFLTNKMGVLINMDIEMQRKREIQLPDPMHGDVRYSSVLFDNNLWFLPLKNKKLYSMDCDTYEFKEWGKEQGISLDLRYGMRRISCQENLMLTTRGHLLLWDSEQKKFHDYYLNIEREELFNAKGMDKTKLELFCNSNHTVMEEYISIADYLEAINTLENATEQANEVGKVIWTET